MRLAPSFQLAATSSAQTADEWLNDIGTEAV